MPIASFVVDGGVCTVYTRVYNVLKGAHLALVATRGWPEDHIIAHELM